MRLNRRAFDRRLLRLALLVFFPRRRCLDELIQPRADRAFFLLIRVLLVERQQLHLGHVFVTVFAAFAGAKLGAAHAALVALAVFLKTAAFLAVAAFGVEAFLFDFWFEGVGVSL